MNLNLLALLIPFVAIIGGLSVGAVSIWTEARRKEREAFYRSELLKKLAESTGTQVQQVLDVMHEDERIAERKRREGQRLGGLIVAMVGIGVTVMLALLTPTPWMWSVGLIPLLIGAALLIYSYLLEPRMLEADKA